MSGDLVAASAGSSAKLTKIVQLEMELAMCLIWSSSLILPPPLEIQPDPVWFRELLALQDYDGIIAIYTQKIEMLEVISESCRLQLSSLRSLHTQLALKNYHTRQVLWLCLSFDQLVRAKFACQFAGSMLKYASDFFWYMPQELEFRPLSPIYAILKYSVLLLNSRRLIQRFRCKKLSKASPMIAAILYYKGQINSNDLK